MQFILRQQQAVQQRRRLTRLVKAKVPIFQQTTVNFPHRRDLGAQSYHFAFEFPKVRMFRPHFVFIGGIGFALQAIPPSYTFPRSVVCLSSVCLSEMQWGR